MITLYSTATPNGHKASIALEEMELDYKLEVIDLSSGAQKEEWFLKMNPNGRIPVIVDHDMDDLAIFESGAILMHLAEKTGKLLPDDFEGRSRAIQWLMFQMGGVGPMQGQANVFFRYFPEKIQPAIDRYQNETKRLYEVLDRRLGESAYLAGDEYSIADIANWCWVHVHAWAGVSIDDLPNLKQWCEAIEARPAVQKGLQMPPRAPLVDKGNADKFIKSAQSMIQK